MDENKLSRMKKLAKKLGDINDDLQILIDAQLFQVTQSGEGIGIVTQLKEAQKNILKAMYNFALAEASAEGEEVTGQLSADLKRFMDASEAEIPEEKE